jgi:TetR/AcrR family transcriptional regulator, mexJK operon transcriptional repressor
MAVGKASKAMKAPRRASRKVAGTRGSGRPPAKQAAARLDKILNIAADIFLQEGFDRASVAAIARIAGSSKETLYSRYPTKEELFEAVISRKTEILLKKFSRVLVQNQPVEKVLEHYGRNLLDFMLLPEMQRLNRTLIACAPQFPELAVDFWRICPEREEEQLAVYLETQVAAGTLMIAEPRKAAEMFFSLCLGQFLVHAHMAVRTPPKTAERNAHIREAVYMFLCAYEKR